MLVDARRWMSSPCHPSRLRTSISTRSDAARWRVQGPSSRAEGTLQMVEALLDVANPHGYPAHTGDYDGEIFDATGLATPEVLARVEFEAGAGMAGYWEGIFPGEVPTGADKVLPQLLTTDTIDLEGNKIRVIKIGQADTAESTVLHVPSLAAVITGDLAYNEVHMMTAECGEAERQQWIANLDAVAALNPTFVVAGHKKVENDNDPKIIGESQQYLRDFSRIVTEETTAAGIIARMVERYPDWGNLRTLWHSSRTVIAKKDG